MENTGISAAEYAERDYAPDSPLPWDTIDIGITKSFLWKECQKAASAEFTADCRKVCHACGLKCRPEEMRKEQPVVTVSPSDRKSGKSLPMEGVSIRARLQYAKKGSLRYLSHLETTTALIRGMRRAGFPFKYTEGFHPGPKVSFGPALPVGTAGLREYMDVELIPPFDVQNGLRLLKDHLPDDLQASVIQAIPKNTKSLAACIVRYAYEIACKQGLSIDAFSKNRDSMIQRKQTSFRLGDMVEDVLITGESSALLMVKDLGEIKVRLDELLPLLFDRPADDLVITRSAMFGWDGAWKEPLEENVWAVKS